MPRPKLHAEDEVLDAARDLVLARGPRAVGVRAIAGKSGAPTGSLYHRYLSRDELMAQMWLRAVRRFQVGYLKWLGLEDPREGAAKAAGWAIRFALRDPSDARILLNHSRRSLLDKEPSSTTLAELTTVNEDLMRALRQVAERLYGSTKRDALERVFYAVVDLPTAVIRRHLEAGTLTARDARRVEETARHLLQHPKVDRP